MNPRRVTLEPLNEQHDPHNDLQDAITACMALAAQHKHNPDSGEDGARFAGEWTAVARRLRHSIKRGGS